MVDEYRAAETYYYFKEPLYFRQVENTDSHFNEYIEHYEKFVDMEIPNEYISVRRHDLTNERNAIQLKGENFDTLKKYYYYKGIVSVLDKWITELTTLYRVSQEYIDCKKGLEQIKEHTEESHTKILLYYYQKGMTDICKQTILNTPLIREQNQ